MAIRSIEDAFSRGLESRIGWSAGKDSTAMLHLIHVRMGIRVRAIWISDDTIWPGQLDYMGRLSESWGIDLVEIPNPESLIDLARQALDRGKDVFERSDHTIPGTGFFAASRQYYQTEGVKMLYLGYRGQESIGRRFRMWRGETYTRADGMTTCCPLIRWETADVYAYLLSHGIELHPYYTRLMAGESPEHVRVDGWFPYQPARTGEVTRLRKLWPEVWEIVRERFPELESMS